MSDLSELRELAMARDYGVCRWAGCQAPVNSVNPLEMAHLDPKGMGGRKSANRLGNVVMLCRYHHDLLDGRTHDGLRREMVLLLRWVTGITG